MSSWNGAKTESETVRPIDRSRMLLRIYEYDALAQVKSGKRET
jgi:hypothetical protein